MREREREYERERGWGGRERAASPSSNTAGGKSHPGATSASAERIVHLRGGWLPPPPTPDAHFWTEHTKLCTPASRNQNVYIARHTHTRHIDSTTQTQGHSLPRALVSRTTSCIRPSYVFVFLFVLGLTLPLQQYRRGACHVQV